MAIAASAWASERSHHTSIALNVLLRYPLPMLTARTCPAVASAGKWLWPQKTSVTLGNFSST